MDAILFNIILATSCLAVIKWGGTPEKIAIGLMLAADIFSLAFGANSHGYLHFENGIFFIDCALLVSILVLALRANRYWPLWITAMQLATVCTHLAFLALGTRMPWAYAFATMLWSFPMVAAVGWGAWRHHQRLHRFKADPPWSPA